MEDFEASDAGVFQPLRSAFLDRSFEPSYAVNPQNQGEASLLSQDSDRQQQLQKSPVESDRGTENQQSDATGSTEKYTEMITKVEDIQKTLATVKETLTQASVRCHILNVDTVTMFNPEVVETLNKTVEDCSTCMNRMATQVVSMES